MFTLDGVSLRFGPHVLFDGVSAAIGAREGIGLIGSKVARK